MTMPDDTVSEETETAPSDGLQTGQPRRRFAFAYMAWVVILTGVVIAIWLSSSGLSAFRYAGF